MAPKKIVEVVGTRPNFMKAAPLIRQLQTRPDVFQSTLIHTGQHYDHSLSQVFFDDLKLPRPDLHLGIGSGTHAVQTGKMMIELELALSEIEPDLVVVFGDVNSTMATALVTSKMCLPLAHVESGLRSFDKTMPEEVNRLVTDRLADMLFVSEPAGLVNLRQEGISDEKVYFVGNIMIDALMVSLDAARGSDVLERLMLDEGSYAALTMHRPANVDHPDTLRRLVACAADISQRLPVVFACHPRTRKNMRRFGIDLESLPKSLMIVEPLGYLDFVKLQSAARIILTDSGGIQQEATYLNIPCLTLRDTTELVETIQSGTNTLCGTDAEKILGLVDEVMRDDYKRGSRPELWDGKAAERIVQVLTKEL
jgi:UDP-N-acetylglucosamine 2-epimerase (non-hydrolysing)